MTDSITIDFGERLSIERAEALYAQIERSLQQSSSKNGDICLDGRQVQFCDTAGLQLLLALQKTLQKTGLTLSWRGYSPVLYETAGYLGLSSVLTLTEPPTSEEQEL